MRWLILFLFLSEGKKPKRSKMNLEKHIDNSKHLMTGYETNT